MRDYDHERKDGWLQAWKELNARVADDIAAGAGDIVRARILHKRADRMRLRLVNLTESLFKKRA